MKKKLFNIGDLPILKTKTLYGLGDSFIKTCHARLRVGCSKLNSDLCNNIKVIPNSVCKCRAAVENVHHFFSACPLYEDIHTSLFDSLLPLTNINLNVLLFGNINLPLNEIS